MSSIRIRSLLFIFTATMIGGSCTQNTTVEQGREEFKEQQEEAATSQEKVIYGTNMDPAVVEASEKDCEQRGGKFNTCGSLCDPGEFCATVCALTCEFSSSPL